MKTSKQEPIEILKQNAIDAHKNADSKEKKLLENLFGKEVFIHDYKLITDFKAVLKAISMTEEMWEAKIQNLEIDEIWLLRFKYILKAINGDFKPDFNSSSQPKWRGWYEKKGSVWVVDGDGFWDGSSGLPGCFYFESREKLYYVWETFNEDFQNWLNAQ